MSEEKKELMLAPVADYTLKDMEQIQEFKEKGLIGLASITDIDIERAMALYIDGKTYRQVCHILKVKKDVILYLSHKFKWWELRDNFLQELQATMPQKILDAKLQDQEFLFDLKLAYRKKMGKHLNKYLKTDDDSWMAKIDQKDIAMYLKTTELLNKLEHDLTSFPTDKPSLVGFNGIGEGMTITKTSENSVEITPKPMFGSKLKQMADLKRQQEQASQPPQKPIHDIDLETSNKKESENKDEK